jgi:hypothetical protein
MMTSMTTRELAGQRRRYCSPALLPNNVHASITEKAGRPGHPGERGTRAHALALPDRDPGPGAERAPRVGYPRPEMPPRTSGRPHVVLMLMRVGAGPGESAVHAAKLKTERESHAKVAVELVASASPRESANARRISAGRYPSPVAQAPAEVIARPHPRLSRNCKASLRSGQSRRKAPAFELCLDQIVGHAKAMGFGAKSGTTDFWWQRLALALALALKPPRILKEAAMAPHKSAQWELPLLPLLSPRMPSPGRQGAGSRLASYLLHDTIHVSTHARTQ